MSFSINIGNFFEMSTLNSNYAIPDKQIQSHYFTSGGILPWCASIIYEYRYGRIITTSVDLRFGQFVWNNCWWKVTKSREWTNRPEKQISKITSMEVADVRSMVTLITLSESGSTIFFQDNFIHCIWHWSSASKETTIQSSTISGGERQITVCQRCIVLKQ